MEGLKDFFVSNGLSLDVSDSKGRCTKAARDFTPGQVLMQQQPYAYVLNAGVDRCDFCCGKCPENDTLLRCASCKHLRYCSVECQKQAWNEWHSIECPVLTAIAVNESDGERSRKLPSSLRLLLNIICKMNDNSKVDAQPTDLVSSSELVGLLQNHYKELPPNMLTSYAQMAHLFNSFMPDHLQLSTEKTTELLCAVSCNAHTICDEEIRPIGKGLYLGVAMVNHSCVPNASLIFEGVTGVLRATAYIAAGEEITITYVELGQPMLMRRAELQEGYFFTCNCARCIAAPDADMSMEDVMLGGLPCKSEGCGGVAPSETNNVCRSCGLELKESVAVAKQVDSLLVNAQKKRDKLEFDDALDYCEEARDLVLECSTSSGFRSMRVHDELMKTYIDVNRWEDALLACRHSIHCYEAAYEMSTNPLMGLQLFMLGKLELNQGELDRAIAALEEALEILEVTHGSEHFLVGDLRSKLAECYMAQKAGAGK